MASALGIVIAIAAVLAVVVTGLFIGLCLGVARITDFLRGGPQREVRGGHRARGAMPFAAGGRHQNPSGPPVASQRDHW